MKRTPRAALFLVPLLLAACASPTPAPVLLTLPPAQAAVAAVPAAPASAPLVAVHRVNIPEYVVARRVRYRADPATLAEWPNTYWAERIEISVTREFVASLRQQLPGWPLCDANCADQHATLSLQVDLAPMDYLRGSQRLQGHARVTVSGVGVPAVVHATREADYDIPATGDSPQAQAQAISALLQKVAADAAGALRAARP